MKFQDYYEVLGVPRDADADAIKKAFRQRAMKYHPDRNAGPGQKEAEAKFKQVNEAYEVLSDPEKRKRYDRFGEQWKQGEEFTPPPGAGRRMSPEEFEEMFGGRGGFSDFFREMFGDQMREEFGGARGRSTRFRRQGADVQAELRIHLDDVRPGDKSRFEIPTRIPCPRCEGGGFVGERVCPTCGGMGTLEGRKTVDLTIPKNLRDGMTLRLRGLGEPGDSGGEPGDLQLTIRIESGRIYRVIGNDVEADVAVAPWEAVDGAKIDVRALDATIAVKVPPGTRAGSRLRLRGKGLDDGSGGRGDFFVVVRLSLPPDPSDRQRELLRELPRAGPSEVGGGARL